MERKKRKKTQISTWLSPHPHPLSILSQGLVEQREVTETLVATPQHSVLLGAVVPHPFPTVFSLVALTLLP